MFNSDPESLSRDMHSQVSAKLLSDPAAAYSADFLVDAATMVNALVPTRNREALARGGWLNRIVSMYAQMEVAGYDSIDPIFITERDELARPLDPDSPPAAPIAGYCARCQDWDAAVARSGGERRPVRAVQPVRFALGVRVIELVLCQSCIGALGVQAS